MPNIEAGKACPNLKQYQQLTSGQLSEVEKESLLRHVEGCDACAQKLNTLPEPDTLVGYLRQADTTDAADSKAVIARLVERLSKLRPEQAPAGTRFKAAVGATRSDDTIDQPPAGAVKKSAYEFLAPPKAPDELGRLGPYRVLEVLGAGGMGVVFRAEDPQLARMVALKAMLPGIVASENARQRFLREARAAAAIKHDHIVSIYQVGEDRGVLFLAMELLDGEPLDVRLQRDGKLPVAEVLRIGRQIALALAAAHKRDLIHRDIKPANIWMESDTNRVKILDFGLARTTSEQAQLTHHGAIVGTPAYMAPEQGKGKEVDHRCDLFSLGCVLYRMATGEPPFHGTDVVSTLLSVATETPRPPQALAPGLPKALSELILSLLAKDAADRPASAEAVAEMLDQIAHEVARPAPVKQRRQWWLAAAAAGSFLAMVAAGVVFFMQTPDGVVRIEIDDPEIKLAVEGHAAIITIADKEPITFKPGQHGLTITRGDFTFDTDKFLIKKGQTITLKVELLPGKMQLVQDGKVIASSDIPLPKTFTNSLGMEFVLVPKGKSWLGGNFGEPGTKEVEITHEFYLGKFEVTQGEWQKVTRNPSHFSREVPGKDAVKDISDADLMRFPVEQVSWNAAQLFVETLNAREKEAGWEYRLPREVEWEYACRGGPMANKFDSAFDFCFEKPTNQLLPEQANFEHGKGLKRTCKVGSYQPNRLGLYDMHGNVWEWCEDLYDPNDAMRASQRVFRGGGWKHGSWACRAAHRDAVPPSFQNNDLGLRLARVPAGKEIVKIATEGKKPAVEAKLPPTFKNDLGMEFALIPKGKAWLGGGGGNPGEQQVTIANDFYLGKYVVTQGQWKAVMGPDNNPSWFARNGGGKEDVKFISDADLDHFPVESLPRNEFNKFLARLNTLDNSSGWWYRLPTEVEWEYACRGGTNSREESAFDFYFDQPTNDLSSERANFNGNRPAGIAAKGKYLQRTCKVGSYPPNRLGLYDMHGNVWQRCEDAEFRLRGGVYDANGFACRAASRRTVASGVHGNLGYRVARVPAAKDAKAASSFAPLFDGKNLTGWTPAPQSATVWFVAKDGILTGRTGPDGHPHGL